VLAWEIPSAKPGQPLANAIQFSVALERASLRVRQTVSIADGSPGGHDFGFFALRKGRGKRE
jgi:hypothetical protein